MEIPAPDPKLPYVLNEMDRRFLRSLRIAQDDAKPSATALPYIPPSPQADGYGESHED